MPNRILIESQWNLNEQNTLIEGEIMDILIESQWNLNRTSSVSIIPRYAY